MVKIKCGGQYLRDFGQGLTDEAERAHDFTPDEAHALCELYPSYTIVDSVVMSPLYAKTAPSFPAGEGRVWVRFKNTWLAVDRQALFLGTRLALEARGQQLEIA